MATKRKGKAQAADTSNKEFFEALVLFEKEKGIPASYMIEKIRKAIIAAVKGAYNCGEESVEVNISAETETFDVFVKRTVVEEIDEHTKGNSLLLEQAQRIDPKAEIGQVISTKLQTKQFGRIAANTAKHVIRQGIRDMEREQVFTELQSRNQELVAGTVERIDPKSGAAIVKIGKVEVQLPKSEQVPGEVLSEGKAIKVFVVDVRELNAVEGDRAPKATISRTHPGLVKRLFETEVPEIFDGTVEIKAVSREAGSRTKLAVHSNDENVDPIGSCIGPRGARVNAIVAELGGEKIDIIKYSEDPAQFIAKALAPADVISVTIDESAPKACRVTVPNDQLSLAIGNKGQNARLAARLTGWKIDIRPAEEADAAEAEVAEE